MQPHKLTDDIDDLVNEVRVEIQQASEDLIEHFIRRSIIQFCEASHYWQEDLGPVLVIDGIDEYQVPTTRTLSCVSVMRVFYEDSDGTIQNLEPTEDESVCYRFWQESPFSFRIAPADDLAGQSLSVVAALKPKVYDDTFRFSENITHQYRDAICAGAKGMLYKMPKKEWTDLTQAEINLNSFESMARDACRHQANGYKRLPARVHKKRSFF